MTPLRSSAFCSCMCIGAFAALANGSISSTSLPSVFLPLVRLWENSESSICFFKMRHVIACSLYFLKRGGRRHGDRLLKILVQYLRNWIYIYLGIQSVVILGWDGCPSPQETLWMQTWDFLKMFWNAYKPCSYIRSCVLFIH